MPAYPWPLTSRLRPYERWSRNGGALAGADDLACKGADFRVPGSKWQHRIHQQGAAKKTARAVEATGKSRGGLSIRVHATGDAMDNPLRLLLTAGQASEYAQAAAPIEGFRPEAILTDKGYNAEAFVGAVQSMGAQAGYGRLLNGGLRT